jgi:predicted transcriptional regulator of viral defense system
MVSFSKNEKVLQITHKAGIIRPRDVARHGIPRVYLRRLCQRGLLVQSGRGLYTLPETNLTENHSLAEICKRVPHAVICLLSALRFHGLTTQVPS